MLASYGTVRAPVPVLRVDQGGPGGPVQIPSLDLQLQPPTQTNKQTNIPGGTFKVAKCVLQRECICDTLRSADFPWRGWRPRHCLLMCSACMLALSLTRLRLPICSLPHFARQTVARETLRGIELILQTLALASIRSPLHGTKLLRNNCQQNIS